MGIDVLIAITMVGLILLQHGKGADAGAAFGSGASATVFGSRGSGSFLTRTTAVLAAAFFVNSLTLAYLARQTPVADSVIEDTSLAGEESVGQESAPLSGDADVPVREPARTPADVPETAPGPVTGNPQGVDDVPR
ncbi:MAG: preprotein translocase subunit SecG [Pseudomonadota bacterium]|nr:preprotein translocase subunit SecG [Pseudomonadota bacterium]